MWRSHPPRSPAPGVLPSGEQVALSGVGGPMRRVGVRDREGEPHHLESADADQNPEEQTAGENGGPGAAGEGDRGFGKGAGVRAVCGRRAKGRSLRHEGTGDAFADRSRPVQGETQRGAHVNCEQSAGSVSPAEGGGGGSSCPHFAKFRGSC